MSTLKDKGRYFTFVLYPESIPEDWLLQLEALDIAMAISPLHDSDKADDGNGIKKPHYHVIYIAKNPVTVDGIRKKIQRTLGKKSISYVEIIDAIRNYYLYLTHESKDAIKKKKKLYDKKDIIHLNGFDIDRYITLDMAEKNEILDTTIELILEYGFENIVDFMEFYSSHGKEHGLPTYRFMNDVIKSNTGMLRLFFDGNYQRRQRDIEKEMNKRTQN